MPATLSPNRAMAMTLDRSLILDAIGMGTLDHPGEPQEWQRRILRAESRKILVNVHRQGGKSSTTAGLAIHTALFNPEALVLLVSRTQRQADLLFDKVVAGWKTLGKPIPATRDNAVTLVLANGIEDRQPPERCRHHPRVLVAAPGRGGRGESRWTTRCSPRSSRC